MKKKVDSRIKTLVENSVKENFRSLFIIIGDRGRDQILNIHYMLNKITNKKCSVLWCYKKDLGFSSHKKKRMKMIKKKIKKGQFDVNIENPFELFLSTVNIRYCYYKETYQILGNTFGMCVLQDFEAITPNVLCRAIETVEGGGCICILLKTMSSLKHLYSLTMDIHSKYITERFKRVEARFNERFLLSLSECKNCLFIDDELNILPISKYAFDIKPISANISFDKQDTEKLESSGCADISLAILRNTRKDSKELEELKYSLRNTFPVYYILKNCVTVDQAKAVLFFSDCIATKNYRELTAVLTAGRGRGKSAALGLSVALAVAYSYSNIFVTSPSPSNVSTLFEFILIGLSALDMKEHVDYEVFYAKIDDTLGNKGYSDNIALRTNEIKNDFSENNNRKKRFSNNYIIYRINIHKNNRQTIQYIYPHENKYLIQAELLIIDEAAAIPLSVVKKLIGSYLVLLSSTTNGYEGTGRALSFKLLKELKRNALLKEKRKEDALSNHVVSKSFGIRDYREISLEIPIRYGLNDPIEKWLFDLLCLGATNSPPLKNESLPLPSSCELYIVNRDALFSYNKSSEIFLHKLVSLFVSSHYKNCPNDLMLMADAPAHMIFTLLPYLNEDESTIPDIYCAIQVCLEGRIAKDDIKEALSKNYRPAGDLIPYTLSQFFINENFGILDGVRIVRIACHPSLQRMGYGSVAVQKLVKFFENCSAQMMQLNCDDIENYSKGSVAPQGGKKNSKVSDEHSLKSSKKRNVEINQKAENSAHASDDNSCENDSQHAVKTKKKKKAEKQENSSENELNLSAPLELLNEKLEARAYTSLLSCCSDEKSFLSTKFDYVGICFGLNHDLYRFWQRLDFRPVYLKYTSNNITDEHSCIMLKTLNENECNKEQAFQISKSCNEQNLEKSCMLDGFVMDFRSRFLNMLGQENFRNVSSSLCLSLVEAPVTKTIQKNYAFEEKNNQIEQNYFSLPTIDAKSIYQFFTVHDIMRLSRYSNQLCDASLIYDLLPISCFLIFNKRIKDFHVSYLQAAILLSLGCQRKTPDEIAEEFNIPTNQVMALFNKAIHKFNNIIQRLLEKGVEAELEEERKKKEEKLNLSKTNTPIVSEHFFPEKKFEEELNENAITIQQEQNKEKSSLLEALKHDATLKQYSMESLTENDFVDIFKGNKTSGLVSIKRKNMYKNIQVNKVKKKKIFKKKH